MITEGSSKSDKGGRDGARMRTEQEWNDVFRKVGEPK